MSHDLTPEQRADMEREQTHEKGVWHMLRGGLFLVIAIGYYFLARYEDAHPPERQKAIWYVFHGIFGTIGGTVFLFVVSVLFLVLGYLKLQKAKQMALVQNKNSN